MQNFIFLRKMTKIQILLTLLFMISFQIVLSEGSNNYETEYNSKRSRKLSRKRIPILIEKSLCIDVCLECIYNDSTKSNIRVKILDR